MLFPFLPIPSLLYSPSTDSLSFSFTFMFVFFLCTAIGELRYLKSFSWPKDTFELRKILCALRCDVSMFNLGCVIDESLEKWQTKTHWWWTCNIVDSRPVPSLSLSSNGSGHNTSLMRKPNLFHVYMNEFIKQVPFILSALTRKQVRQVLRIPKVLYPKK